MLIEINPENINQRKISMVVDVLKAGGLAIIPTDTVYALCCDIYNHKAVEKICKLRNTKIERASFSFLMHDLSAISRYTKPLDRSIFKLLNRALPGPYTFILNSGKEVPSIFSKAKKTVGIRIPDNKITAAIIEHLGNPLMAASIHDENKLIDYTTDPFQIFENYGEVVDVIIDGGFGNVIPSTVIDCTNGEQEIVRIGLGSVDILS